MSAYQLLKQFQDEVERETGVRPEVSVHFFSHIDKLTDEKCRSLRDYLTGGKANVIEAEINDGNAKWTVYKSQSFEDRVYVSAHGPERKEAQPCTK